MGTIPSIWVVVVTVLMGYGPAAGASGSDDPGGSRDTVSLTGAETVRTGPDGAATARTGADSSATGSEGVGTVPTASEGAQDPAAILRRTSAVYEKLEAIKADFTQELQNTLLGRTTRSAGTLYQREPDKFLMDFSDPEGDLIVSDGRYFWLYYPSVDEKQVIRMPRRNQGLDLQAQFIGDVNARFDVTYHGTEALRGRTAHVMTLEPRQPLGYRRLKVWIDDEDHLVRRFELTEESGNVRHMELTGVAVDPALPDSLFEFTPPADAIVVSRG